MNDVKTQKRRQGLTPLLFLAGLLAGPAGMCAEEAARTDPAKGFAGTVVETMGTDQYTYMNIDSGDRKTWVAGPKMEVAKGDIVTIPPGGLLMENFESPTFKRTFPEIFFVGQARKGRMPGVSKDALPGTELPPRHPPPHPRAAGGLPKDHPALPGEAAAAAGIVTGKYAAELPAGPATPIPDVIAKAADLKGKTVRVRGVVSKVNANILGRNWVHVQEGTNDLTVTTADLPVLKDAVAVSGVVDTKADFGSGYKFDVMLIDARIARDPAPAAPPADKVEPK